MQASPDIPKTQEEYLMVRQLATERVGSNVKHSNSVRRDEWDIETPIRSFSKEFFNFALDYVTKQILLGKV